MASWSSTIVGPTKVNPLCHSIPVKTPHRFDIRHGAKCRSTSHETNFPTCSDLPPQSTQPNMHRHKTRVTILIAALLNAVITNASSRACSIDHPLLLTPGAPSQLYSFNSDAGGGKRTYLLHLPKSYKHTEPNPLILAFHGKAQTAATFENETQFSSSDFNIDAIVVYPQGLDVSLSIHPQAGQPKRETQHRTKEERTRSTLTNSSRTNGAATQPPRP